MPLDFPSSPNIGDTWTGSNGVEYIWDGVKWVAAGVGGGSGAYLPIAGGTMLGPLNVTATGGTTSRSVQDRWATVVDVRDFGAVGDGNTDDTAALQAAVNSITGLRGGRVHIGNLRLYINGNVTLPTYARLSGDFRHSGLNASQDWYQVGSQICLGSSGMITAGVNEIDHILFIRAGLYTHLPANISDANAIVANFGGTALNMPNAPDCMISACMFLGFTTAINTPNSSRTNIIDCMFDCTNGIYCAASTDVSRYERLHFWPFLTMLVPGVGTTPGPLHRTGYAMKMENNEWDQLINCFQFGYDLGFWCDNCSNNSFVSCHSDYVSSGPTQGGFQFTGTSNYSKLINATSMTPIVINTTGGGLNPMVEIIGGTFNNGINVVAGAVIVVGATFESGSTIGVNFGVGTIGGSVMGCHFNGVATPIQYANASVQALVSVIGNFGTAGTPLIQEQTLQYLNVPSFAVKSAYADIEISCTGAGTDQKIWDILPSASGGLSFRLLNDAFSAENTWLSVTRTGYVAQQITVTAPTITLATGATGSTTAVGTFEATGARIVSFGSNNNPSLTCWDDAQSMGAGLLLGGDNLLYLASTNASGAYAATRATIDASGNFTTSGSLIPSNAGPTIRAGAGAATGTQPGGSLWLRTDGTVGTHLYVSAGGGTWNAVAGV